MRCPACHTPVPETSRFCPACGRSVPARADDAQDLYSRLAQGVEHLAAAQDSLRAGFDAAADHLQDLKLLLSQVKGLEAEAFTPPPPVIEAPAAREPQALPPSEPTVQPEAEQPLFEEPSSPLTEDSGPPPIPTARPQEAPAPSRPSVSKAPDRPREQSGFEIALGQKWLLIIGIVVMIFGVGYFLKYSFDQGWISPPVRVAMAYGWGLAMLVAGEIARRKGFRTFGLYVIGGAVAVLYFSAFAGYRIYDLVGPATSFGVMIAITLSAVLFALLYDSPGLAALALVGGFLTPVLLSTGEDHQMTLMTYMTVLNAGILSLAFFKRWTLLHYLGLAATHVLYLTWLLTYNTPPVQDKFWAALIFLNLFFLIYCVIPVLYDLRSRNQGASHAGYMLIPNLLFCFVVSQVLVQNAYDDDWGAAVCFGHAAILLALYAALHIKGKHRQPTFLIMGILLGLLLLPAVSFITSDHRATLYWITLALASFLYARQYARTLPMVWFHVFMTLATVKFLFHDYGVVFHLASSDSSAYYALMNNTSFGLHFEPFFRYLLSERLFTSALLVGSLLLAALLGRGLSFGAGRRKGPGLSPLTGFYGSVFLSVLLIMLSVECSALIHDLAPAATMTSLSVLWTICSVMLMVAGFRLPSLALRIVSFCLFGITLTKVFLLDMAQVSTPFRIMSFLILGTLLVGTSFLYYKFKPRVLGIAAPSRSPDNH